MGAEPVPWFPGWFPGSLAGSLVPWFPPLLSSSLLFASPRFSTLRFAWLRLASLRFNREQGTQGTQGTLIANLLMLPDDHWGCVNFCPRTWLFWTWKDDFAFSIIPVLDRTYCTWFAENVRVALGLSSA